MSDNIITRTWSTTPPLTRLIAIVSFTTSLLVYIKAISPFTLSYSSYYITTKHQYWRILTSFFYFGPVSLDNLLHIIFLCRYSKMLEEGFSNNSSDYFIMLLFIMTSIFLISQYFLFYILGYSLTLMGSCLSSTITYIWTRKNPTTNVQLLGCVVFQAFYLPFLVPVFGFLSERKVPVDDVVGILVGHLFYFLKYVFPRYGYCDLLRTPRFIRRILGEEIEEEIENENNQMNLENERKINDRKLKLESDRNLENEEGNLESEDKNLENDRDVNLEKLKESNSKYDRNIDLENNINSEKKGGEDGIRIKKSNINNNSSEEGNTIKSKENITDSNSDSDDVIVNDEDLESTSSFIDDTEIEFKNNEEGTTSNDSDEVL